MIDVCVEPEIPRVTWHEPLPVSFGFDADQRRTVTFGPGRYGGCNATVNGIDAEIATIRFTEVRRGHWRLDHGKIRRHGKTIEYLSDVAHVKVRDVLADLAPKLAERHYTQFRLATIAQAQTEAENARMLAQRLLAEAAAHQDRALVADLVRSGAAAVTPLPEQRRVSIASVVQDRCGPSWAVASINTDRGRIGWVVKHERSRYATDTMMLPEHLVEERR